MKIICLNLWNGGLLFDASYDFLKQEDGDIVLLQEVYGGTGPELEKRYRSLAILRQSLGYPYSDYAPAFLEDVHGADIESGNLVLSRYPVIHSQTVFYDIPFSKRQFILNDYTQTPRNLQHVVIDTGSHQLHVMNTQGVWGEDGEDNDRRLTMGRIIAEEASQCMPLILAGDFNVRPHTQTIQQIERTLINVFKNQLTTTFNLKRKDLAAYPGFATAVVDMVFVTPDIKVIRSVCPQVDVSDHLPLVVEIELI